MGCKPSWVSLVILLVALGCGGTAERDDGPDDDAGAPAGGGSPAAGGDSASGGSGGQAVAGAPASGGSPATGGASATGGVPTSGGSAGAAGEPAGGTGGIDCSMVGCGPPPMCSAGCAEPCGCCPCAEGETQGGLVCRGGCWEQIGATDTCTHQGRSYPVGATFPAGDGCNTCSCAAGGMVACTEMACICSPDTETNRREYVTADPAQCAVVDYSCPPNTTHFSNDCGCGCEQDPSCPEWFNCMPGPGVPPCDVAEIQASCPYSGIAF